MVRCIEAPIPKLSMYHPPPQSIKRKERVSLTLERLDRFEEH